MKVYIAVCQDRHADIDAVPFTDKKAAIKHCRKFAGEELEVVPLNKAMINSGWVFYGKFSCEDDYVLVLEREMELPL